MDQDRLEQLIAAYGADPARWPAGERSAAQALASPADLAAAHAVDAALDAYAVEPPSPALRRRILARAPQPRPARGWRLAGAIGLSGAGLAAACAIGMLVGVDLGARPGDRDAETAAAFGPAMVFGAPIEADRQG